MPAPQRNNVRYLPLFWGVLNSAITYIARVLKNPTAAELLLDSTELAISDHLTRPTLGRVYHGKREHETTYYLFCGRGLPGILRR